MNNEEFEKRIATRAEEKFNEQFKALVQYIHSHPIGAQMKIKIDGKEMTLANFGTNYGLMNEKALDNSNAHLTNLASIKESLLKEYRQKEVDDILAKLDNFSYLFNQG